MNYLKIFLLLIGLQFSATAQDKIKITQTDYANQNIEMADKFREEGKIYVVVAVILTVLSGMFVYLFLLDKKITNLEKLAEDNRE
jgi:hypothetical protein